MTDFDLLQYAQSTFRLRDGATRLTKSRQHRAPLSAADMTHAIQRFGYFFDQLDRIIPIIHDLWSANLFGQGFTYAPNTNLIAKQHQLLKPVGCMTSLELMIERMLAQGDLESIYACIEQYVSPERAHLSDCSPVQNTLAALAEDIRFVRQVAVFVHARWRAIKRLFGAADDPRLDLTFEQLPEIYQTITLDNVRVDIIALAVFADEGQRQCGRGAASSQEPLLSHAAASRL